MVGEKIKNYMPCGMTMKFKCQGPPSGTPPVRAVCSGPCALTAQQRSYQCLKPTVFHNASACLLTLHTRHATVRGQGSERLSLRRRAVRASVSASWMAEERRATTLQWPTSPAKHSAGVSLNTKQNSFTRNKNEAMELNFPGTHR